MNQAQFMLLAMRAFGDVTAAQSALLVVLGHRIGLYRALATRPRTADDLASSTETDRRLLGEWLKNQVAAGYITLEAGLYSMTEEQSRAVESFLLFSELSLNEVEEAFRTGEPLRSSPEAVAAIRRQSRAKYGQIDWLPPDLIGRLERGIAVAEIGCGDGSILAALAARCPSSRFTGFDVDAPEHVAGVTIRRANATAIASERFDLVFCIEALHEMNDPDEVLKAIRTATGHFVAIEPSLADDDAMTVRYLSSLSALFCAPLSRNGLGAAARDADFEALFRRAGFTVVHRVARTVTTSTWECRA